MIRWKKPRPRKLSFNSERPSHSKMGWERTTGAKVGAYSPLASIKKKDDEASEIEEHMENESGTLKGTLVTAGARTSTNNAGDPLRENLSSADRSLTFLG